MDKKIEIIKDVTNLFKFVTGFAGGTLLLVTTFLSNINVKDIVDCCIRLIFTICCGVCYITLAICVTISLLTIRKIVNGYYEKGSVPRTKYSTIFSIASLVVGFISFIILVLTYIYIA